MPTNSLYVAVHQGPYVFLFLLSGWGRGWDGVSGGGGGDGGGGMLKWYLTFFPSVGAVSYFLLLLSGWGNGMGAAAPASSAPAPSPPLR